VGQGGTLRILRSGWVGWDGIPKGTWSAYGTTMEGKAYGCPRRVVGRGLKVQERFRRDPTGKDGLAFPPDEALGLFANTF